MPGFGWVRGKLERMSDLFDGYAAALDRSTAWDEMFSPGLNLREDYQPVEQALRALSLTDVTARAESMARTFLDRGVTFDYAGEERAWPLDIVPRVIPADDWDVLERGVTQRVRTLEAFLDDVYDQMNVVKDGVVPRSLITTSEHFHRAVHGFRPPGACVFTSPGSTWSVTPRARSGCWRTMSVSPPASPTSWRTAEPCPRDCRRPSAP